MASSVIGALRVNLGLDSAKFSRGMTDAQKRLKVARNQFVAAAAAASAFGAAISAAAMKGAREINKLAMMSKSLDATVTSVQALQIAAADVGLEGMEKSLVRLNRRLGAAEFGAGPAAKTVKALNLDLKALSKMDADERIAHLADALKDSGMSMQQVARHAQNLGFEQAQAAEFFAQGGDAIRGARARLVEYGLAVSQVDAQSIRNASVQLSDLGMIGQYVGQQLAIKLVPAMGAVAQAMTDSLKEGGLLRAMIDGIIDNLARMSTYVATLTVGLGVKFIGALVIAKVGVLNLASALVALKVAIARTGIGLLVVGAGELVYWLARVVSAAGGVSETLKRVYDVGKATLLGVGNTAWGLVEIMAGVANGIAGSFVAAFALIARQWDKLVNGMAGAWNAVAESAFGQGLGLGALGKSDAGAAIQRSADALMDQGSESILRGGRRIADAGKAVADAFSEALKPLGNVVDEEDGDRKRVSSWIDDLGGKSKEAGKAAREAARAAKELAAEIQRLEFDADPVKRYNHELMKLVRLKDAGLSDKAFDHALKGLKDTLSDISSGFDTFKSSASSAFEGLITGANSFKEALAGVLSSLANVFAQSATAGLFKGLKIPGFATGTPYAPGGLSMVGERGPELVNLPRGSQVLNARQTRGALGGGRQQVEILLRAPEGFTAEQVSQVQGISLRVAETRIGANNRAQSDARYLRGG